MRKRSVILSLVAAGALVASGCEPDAKTAPVGNASALVGEEEAAKAVADDSETDPFPLRVEWTDGAESGPQSKLSFTLENATEDRTLDFSVSVVAQSALGDGELALGALTLAPGESAELGLAADELPVRSDVVVSQISVGIRWAYEAAAEVARPPHLRATRFYRHEPGLSSLRAYTAASFASELGGVLYDVTGKDGSETIGEVANAEGEAELASASSINFAAHDEDGKVIGVIERLVIGAGDASGEGAIVTPDEEAAEEEMEVGDE
jgi:hypothetical protein